MTVGVGDELREFVDALVKAGDYRTQSEVMRDALRLLREKQAKSRLQDLGDLLAEGIGSGDANPWNKDTFLKNVRAWGSKLADFARCRPNRIQSVLCPHNLWSQ